MAISKKTQFDIVIAGGGMAGSTLAWALLQARPELQIAIIEQQKETISPVSFDSRSIALARASAQLLEQWGLWAELKHHACAIETIHVSDRGHFGKTRLTAEEYLQDALGYVIEVEHIGVLLAQKLQQKNNVTWFSPNTITQLNPSETAQNLLLHDGTELSCRLLLIAEGGMSPTRNLAGFNVTEQPYQQSAVIANLALAQQHQHIAYERFTEHGPIALLPLSQDRYSLVFTTTAEHAAELMQQTDSEF